MRPERWHMKKLFLLSLFCTALCITGCPQSPAEPVRQDYAGSHNAMNSLDYQGEYIFTGDAAQREIRQVNITYGGEYSLLLANGSRLAGNYQWDVTGTVITLLLADGKRVQFFVGENYLKLVSNGPEEGRIFRK